MLYAASSSLQLITPGQYNQYENHSAAQTVMAWLKLLSLHEEMVCFFFVIWFALRHIRSHQTAEPATDTHKIKLPNASHVLLQRVYQILCVLAVMMFTFWVDEGAMRHIAHLRNPVGRRRPVVVADVIQ